MRALAISFLILSGCAVGNDCAMNSFELGQRDGILAAVSNQADRYAASCGSRFDAGRYAEGYRDGFARRGKVYSL
jgi:hypothetical protein